MKRGSLIENYSIVLEEE